MPKITLPGLRSGLIAAFVALLPLTEAGATGDSGPGVPVPTLAGAPPGRSCAFTPFPANLGKTVQIIAGPNAFDNFPPTASFPVKVSDPLCGLAGQCLKWEYRWIYTLVNPSYSFVTLDSDLNLLQAAGGAISPRISAPITGDPTDVGDSIAEARVVRFNASGSGGTLNAALYTALDARVGKVTAGFQSGEKKGFCGIQGAENASGGDFLLSQSRIITTNTLGCMVDWTLSPDGCATNAALNPASQALSPQFCSITTPTIGTGGPAGAIVSATCGAEISVPGSTTTCRWNSIARTNICVTVP